MIKLRKEIKESFFNPVLHFLPLLLFMVVDEFWGMDIAWKVAFPVAFGIVIYVYFRYNQIFIWNLVFTFMFMGIGVFASLAPLLPLPLVFQGAEDKLVVLAFVIVFLFFRKQIQHIILQIMPRLIPMSNNFSELYRAFWVMFFVLLSYISSNLLLRLFALVNYSLYFQLLQGIFIAIICVLSIFEVIRVHIIRSKLVREEWWPIVTKQGKIIGSIQHLISLSDEKKYMHPIVRVLLIDKGMIFMQKRSAEDLIFPGFWDTAISNHVRVGETIEQCIDRTTEERYALKGVKYMYLSNYTNETPKEHQYAFLFVSCQLTEINPNPTFIELTKWWTQQQIEENLDKAIFTENFKIEYDLLQRSGLLETGKCQCNCKLKEVIYQQPSAVK
jgi:isopentenyldiphosphate isomerase